MGQLKNTLVCPTEGCGNISIKFDPYTSVALPIPSSSSPSSLLIVSVYFYFSQLPIKFSVKIEKDFTYSQASQKLNELVNIDDFGKMELQDNKISQLALESFDFKHFEGRNYIFGDIWSNKIFEIREAHTKLKNTQSTELPFGYPAPDPQFSHLYFQINIVFKVLFENNSQKLSGSLSFLFFLSYLYFFSFLFYLYFFSFLFYLYFFSSFFSYLSIFLFFSLLSIFLFFFHFFFIYISFLLSFLF